MAGSGPQAGPPLLAQAIAYRVFGVNEFAARLPSALGIVACCSSTTWAAHVRATTVPGGRGRGQYDLVCALSHSATTDACCSPARWWCSTPARRSPRATGGWSQPAPRRAGRACQGAGRRGPAGQSSSTCLASGNPPAGPRGCSADPRVPRGRGPWYALVEWRTHGEFAGLPPWRGRRPVPGAEGEPPRPFAYHPCARRQVRPVVGILPRPCGSRSATRRITAPERAPYQFLLWAGTYLLFFSIAATKLPNYRCLAYPPLALLTADLLDRWRRGTIRMPGWCSHGTQAWRGRRAVGRAGRGGRAGRARCHAGTRLKGWSRGRGRLVPVAGAIVRPGVTAAGHRLVAGVSVTSLDRLTGRGGRAGLTGEGPRDLVAQAAGAAAGSIRGSVNSGTSSRGRCITPAGRSPGHHRGRHRLPSRGRGRRIVRDGRRLGGDGPAVPAGLPGGRPALGPVQHVRGGGCDEPRVSGLLPVDDGLRPPAERGFGTGLANGRPCFERSSPPDPQVPSDWLVGVVDGHQVGVLSPAVAVVPVQVD